MNDVLKEFTDATPKTEISVSEFDELVVKLRGLRDRKDAMSAEAKLLNEEIEVQEAKILNCLKLSGKDRWEVPGAGMAYRYNKLEVKFPTDFTERRKLAGWVRERYGDEMVTKLFTVNYQALNSFFKEEYTKAAETGALEVFKIDGLDAPTSRETIGFRRK